MRAAIGGKHHNRWKGSADLAPLLLFPLEDFSFQSPDFPSNFIPSCPALQTIKPLKSKSTLELEPYGYNWYSSSLNSILKEHWLSPSMRRIDLKIIQLKTHPLLQTLFHSLLLHVIVWICWIILIYDGESALHYTVACIRRKYLIGCTGRLQQLKWCCCQCSSYNEGQ